jgi:hypothetical protein
MLRTLTLALLAVVASFTLMVVPRGNVAAEADVAPVADGALDPTGRIVFPGPPYVIPFPIGCRGPAVPLPTPPPPPANPGPAGTATYQVCPRAVGRIPLAVQQYALANPHAIRGYGQLRNPSVPAGPWNTLRTWLDVTDPGKPFSRCNSVVWKAGCR